MKRSKPAFRRTQVSAVIAALFPLAVSSHAVAQTAPEPEQATVVVTGFRASLQSSIAAKRSADSIVDVIKAEDIGKFPDNNLSESMQRIPGVAIDRDAGEGRTITVRGLGGQFVRTKLNGMEALATTGGRDSSGGANRDRGFDFNVFAAELFSSIKVSKAASAESEEGSLGSTIDLTTPRPFDYKGFALAGSVTGQYNDLSKKGNRRETFMVSTRSDDKRWGAMFSVAESTNDKIEEGPSTGRWENASLSTAAGAPTAQSTGMRFKSYSADGGKTFIPIPFLPKTNAAAGSLADLSGEALNISKALHPRIPRYGHIEYEVKRLGMTGAVQFKPIQGTLLTLDAMHSNYVANRDEHYLEAISFSRGDGNPVGNPSTSIYNYAINKDKGIIEKASFNNVDIRSENRHDELESKFKQLNLTLDQKIGDRMQLKLFTGGSRSIQDNPEQTTVTLDAYDVQNYSYDYANPLKPVFDYGKSNGCTVDQACYWSISASNAKGDPSLVRIRPNRTDNKFTTSKIDLSYDLNDNYTLKIGYNVKKFVFKTSEARLNSENIPANAAAFLNANLGNYVTSQTMGSGNGTQTWLIPNYAAIKNAINFGCNCVVPALGGALPATGNDFTVSNTVTTARALNQDALERDRAMYLQLDFNQDLWGIPVRGNTGVRVVKTDQSTSAFLSLPAKNGVAQAPTYQTAKQNYTDTLPSLNLNAEPVKDVLVRFGASKVMSRPGLQSLTPAGSIDLDKRTYSGGNPTLEPIRGTTYDLNLEWYKDKDTLFSAGYFFKDMKTYIQRSAYQGAYSSLGLDPALGAANGIDASTPFTITNWVNTQGGLIRGYEISLQKTFSFLPAPFNDLGGVINYTHVESKMKYRLSPASPAVTVADLLGMSPKSANATLYYETKKLSARVTGAYRSKYTYVLLPGSGSDFQGKNSTFNVDAQVSYNITPQLTLTVQGVNLTDQYDDRFNSYNNERFGNFDGNAPSDAVHTGRSYFVGLRYKY